MVIIAGPCGKPVIVPVRNGNFSLHPWSQRHQALVLWTTRRARVQAWRMTIRHHIGALALAVASLAMSSQHAAAQDLTPGPAAWFGIHFIDTSTEGDINGPRQDETDRVAMTEDYVAGLLTERGFTLTEPAPEDVARIRNPAHSNGADTRIAAEMGSRYAITGEVQKTSNLIQSVNLRIRDAETGQTLRAGAVDIRGNTDDAFQRGYRYLLKNIIFREDTKE